MITWNIPNHTSTTSQSAAQFMERLMMKKDAIHSINQRIKFLIYLVCTLPNIFTTRFPYKRYVILYYKR